MTTKSPNKVQDMPKDTLWSTINTPAMRRRIDIVAAKRFPAAITTSTFFDHGHWWLVISENGEDTRSFDVVDAEGGQSIDGFDFEEV